MLRRGSHRNRGGDDDDGRRTGRYDRSFAAAVSEPRLHRTVPSSSCWSSNPINTTTETTTTAYTGNNGSGH